MKYIEFLKKKYIYLKEKGMRILINHNLNALRIKLDRYKRRVDLRYSIYDAKHQDANISFVMPPQLKMIYQSTLGWCGKAVDALADRLAFKRFDNDNFKLNDIFNLNNPDIFFDSAILSALIASCSFVYISKDEEGKARLQVIEASNATGIIDPITGLLKEGYAVLERDEQGNPLQEAHFLADATIYYKDGKVMTSIPNPAGIPLLVPIIYRPDAVRPFGHSRITRTCMYLQEHAKRTLERADVTAEFYSFPQKYVIGLSPDAERVDKWKATVSSFLSFDKDMDGDSPKLGQFAQPSMSPFTEQLKTLASSFAGESGLTLDDLGFVTENPSSAEAIKASHETLRVTARKAQRCLGSGFLNVGYVARCAEDEKPYKRNEFYNTKPMWYPVFEPDISALSNIGDATIKINQAVEGYFDKDKLNDLTGLDM